MTEKEYLIDIFLDSIDKYLYEFVNESNFNLESVIEEHTVRLLRKRTRDELARLLVGLAMDRTLDNRDKYGPDERLVDNDIITKAEYERILKDIAMETLSKLDVEGIEHLFTVYGIPLPKVGKLY